MSHLPEESRDHTTGPVDKVPRRVPEPDRHRSMERNGESQHQSERLQER